MYFYFLIHMCLCVCVNVRYANRGQKKVLDATKGGITGSSDLPDVGVRDRTLVFCKHAKHS